MISVASELPFLTRSGFDGGFSTVRCAVMAFSAEPVSLVRTRVTISVPIRSSIRPKTLPQCAANRRARCEAGDDMSDQNPDIAITGGTGEPAVPADSLPTRASLRKAAGLRAAQSSVSEPRDARLTADATTTASTANAASAATPVRSALPATSAAPPKAARAAQSAANATTVKRTVRSRWRGIRSTVIMALVVPGIFGTVALPAYAFETTPEAAATAEGETGAQSLIVNDWTAETVSRDSYTATTPEELSASKAALAAAAAQAASAAAKAKNGTSSSSAGAYTGPAGAWVRPVGGSISSPYGPRGLICNGAGCSNSFHDGIDFSGSCGTPVGAVSAGRVTFVGNAGSYGNRVIVDHGGGIESIYGHLQGGSYRVSVGDTVEPGTIVAGIGATGVVTGCHLDLKISVNGSFTSPAPFLASRGLKL